MPVDTILIALVGSVLLNIALFILNIRTRYEKVSASSSFLAEKTKLIMILILSVILNGVLIYLLVRYTVL